MAAMPPGVLQTGARQGRNPNRQCRGRRSCRPHFLSSLSTRPATSFKWEVVARLPKTSTDLEHAIRPVPADIAVEEWRTTQDDVLEWLGSSATSHERGHHAG
jgi:hypothetical protein